MSSDNVKCPGTTAPRDVRNLTGNGSKSFGKRLGTCVCGQSKFVKNGRIYAHKVA